MNLELSDEQRMLGESVRRMLGDRATSRVVRAMENDPMGYPEDLWKSITEMGLTGLTIEEKYGGMASGALETTVVYEEFGRALCPSPHFVSSILAAGVLARAGNDEQKEHWLPGIAGGKAILTTAWLEPGNSFASSGVQCTARVTGEQYILSGKKHLVPFAAAARHLLVLVRTGPGDNNIDMLLVDPRARGVSMTQQKTMASDPEFEIQFTEVVVPASARLGAPGSGWAHWQAALKDGRIALAAWAVGCADRALEIATDYARERVQFGRPIGSFQGLAHPLASVATAVTGSRLLAQEAAWARDTGRPYEQLADMAHVQAADTARLSTKTGHQVLGGIGFTVDIDMQLYYRRAKQNQLAWGNVRSLDESIAVSVLGEGDQ